MEKSASKKRSPAGTAGQKSAETRERILEAGREVFTQSPFRAAGMRAIADRAGVRHPLILHYFDSKAGLLEAVADRLEKEVVAGYPEAVANLRASAPDYDFEAFLSGFVNHCFLHPDAFCAIMLNMGEGNGGQEGLPGLARMAKILGRASSLYRDQIFSRAPAGQLAMFVHVFILLTAHFVGAQSFHQKSLGIQDPVAYRKWVRQAFTFIFAPIMEALARGESLAAPEASAPDPGVGAIPPLPPAAESVPKGEKARRRILAAARQVFSRQPYNAASIRAIGAAGGFDFTRIHHFYPAKEDIFEAVARDTFEEFNLAAETWRRGLAGLPVEEVFLTYLFRALSYCFARSEALGLLVHNMAVYDRFRDISGFNYMARFHQGLLSMVRELMPENAPEDLVRMWLYAITTLVISFTGAPAYPAALMGLDPASESYQNRIRSLLLFLFMPSFRVIIERS
ncbi:MAG: TetR family transcriptional regulator [Thermodesulfobacteriota bacterium]